MNKFAMLRENRHRPIYRNRRVWYNGIPYRIASVTSTGNLILRAQIIVHPHDGDLQYVDECTPTETEDEINYK